MIRMNDIDSLEALYEYEGKIVHPQRWKRRDRLFKNVYFRRKCVGRTKIIIQV